MHSRNGERAARRHATTLRRGVAQPRPRASRERGLSRRAGARRPGKPYSRSVRLPRSARAACGARSTHLSTIALPGALRARARASVARQRLGVGLVRASGLRAGKADALRGPRACARRVAHAARSCEHAPLSPKARGVEEEKRTLFKIFLSVF